MESRPPRVSVVLKGCSIEVTFLSDYQKCPASTNHRSLAYLGSMILLFEKLFLISFFVWAIFLAPISLNKNLPVLFFTFFYLSRCPNNLSIKFRKTASSVDNLQYKCMKWYCWSLFGPYMRITEYSLLRNGPHEGSSRNGTCFENWSASVVVIFWFWSFSRIHWVETSVFQVSTICSLLCLDSIDICESGSCFPVKVIP